MEQNKAKKLYDLLEQIPVTEENENIIKEIKEDIDNGRYSNTLKNIAKLKDIGSDIEKRNNLRAKNNKKEKENVYPKELSNIELERQYIGLLLTNPKSIVKYYFIYEECFFEDSEVLNIYKSVLFTEGGNYTPEIAKRNFNFSKEDEHVYALKNKLKN